MIRYDAPQGSPEWKKARLGVVTASGLDNLLTPGLKLSSSSQQYLCRLVAEWLLDRPLDDAEGGFLERGKVMEDEGRRWYSMVTDTEVDEVGFLLADDRSLGSSPDGLIGDDGGLEIKVPAAHTHVSYLLEPSSLVQKYRAQVQGGLLVTGRKWWDLISYNPSMPAVRVRVGPDLEYQAAVAPVLKAFNAKLAAAKDQLKAHRAPTDQEILESLRK